MLKFIKLDVDLFDDNCDTIEAKTIIVNANNILAIDDLTEDGDYWVANVYLGNFSIKNARIPITAFFSQDDYPDIDSILVMLNQ